DRFGLGDFGGLTLVGDERARRGAAAGDLRERAGAQALGLLLGLRDLVAVVHPHLHADDAERGLALGRPEIDLRAERVERDPSLAVPLAAGHLGATEAAAALDPNT